MGDILLYTISFFTIWYGAGLIISSVDGFSSKLKLSSFAISFFILGLLTSVPELAVGITAISGGKQEIFVGNLLGGIIVIFLLIIPFLAIFGNGIKLHHYLTNKNVLLSLFVIEAPALFILDRSVTIYEGFLFILFYIALFYFIEKKRGVMEVIRNNTHMRKSGSFLVDMVKIVFGVGLITLSSNIIVDKTVYFSSVLNIPTFYMSLIILSIGTNLPEFSLAVRSVLSGRKEIAFGDYMGSAAANTLLFGLLTLLSGGEVLTVDNFLTAFIFIAVGLISFYYFSRSKNDISMKEGPVLFFLYLFFVLLELSG